MGDVRLDKINQLLQLLTYKPLDVKLESGKDQILVNITLSENDSGSLIGYHGEKIDALQLIISLILNNNVIVYTPVLVDINDYRKHRQEALHQLADEAAVKAVESGREILMPHLPPLERRIIHLYLESRQDVTTYSEGEGESRRLVVRPNPPQT